jgi:predicted  nucleic acid-binding Zn-ribbon protein
MREQLNAVKTNKEYQALKNEIRFAEIELRRFEDEELEKLDRFEQDASRIAEAEAALKKAEDETAQFRLQQEAEASALEAEIRQAERDRADIARDLPADMVSLFERVANKHHDGAMCPLVKDEDDPQGSTYSCGGCYMRLTENVYVKLLGNSSELITCPNCARILYLEP